MDHIHSINQVMEKCREYQTPLWLIFVDYEKAFDSVEINAVLNALINQNIGKHEIKLIKEIYQTTSTNITLFNKNIQIPIKRGVRQGDPLSPKLFNAALQEIFKNLNWDTGLNIEGGILNHLSFADDNVLIGNTAEEVETKLEDLNRKSNETGLKINMSKTKVMTNQNDDPRIIQINGEEVERVNEYVYLGQVLRWTTPENQN